MNIQKRYDENGRLLIWSLNWGVYYLAFWHRLGECSMIRLWRFDLFIYQNPFRIGLH